MKKPPNYVLQAMACLAENWHNPKYNPNEIMWTKNWDFISEALDGLKFCWPAQISQVLTKNSRLCTLQWLKNNLKEFNGNVTEHNHHGAYYTYAIDYGLGHLVAKDIRSLIDSKYL